LADLDSRVKNHPVAAWMVIALFGALLGTLAGIVFAFEATRSITEGVLADNPADPLDMLPFVQLMYVVLGFCGGAIVGLFAGGVVYVANRSQGAQRLNI